MPKGVRAARDRRNRWKPTNRQEDPAARSDEQLGKRAEEQPTAEFGGPGIEGTDAAVKIAGEADPSNVSRAEPEGGQVQETERVDSVAVAESDTTNADRIRRENDSKAAKLTRQLEMWVDLEQSVDALPTTSEQEAELMTVDTELYVDSPRCRRCDDDNKTCRGMKTFSCERCKTLKQTCSNSTHGKAKRVGADTAVEISAESLTKPKGKATKRKGSAIAPMTRPKRPKTSASIIELSDDDRAGPSSTTRDAQTRNADGTSGISQGDREMLEDCAKAMQDIMRAVGVIRGALDRLTQEERE